MSRKAALVIVYGIAVVPFLVGLIITNLSGAAGRAAVPAGVREPTAVVLPGERSECDKLSAEQERRSCNVALEAARRDEMKQAPRQNALDTLRSRTRAEIDAGEADRMVLEPRCAIETQHQNGICQLHLDTLPVRLLSASIGAPASPQPVTVSS